MDFLGAFEERGDLFEAEEGGGWRDGDTGVEALDVRHDGRDYEKKGQEAKDLSELVCIDEGGKGENGGYVRRDRW